MKKHILILGAGFGGLATANFLRKNLDEICKITVIDKKSWFMMGFVNLWILNGTRTLQDSQIPLDGLKRKGIDFLNDQVTGIDCDANTVYTASSGIFAYDYLVVSLGAELVPEEVDGFTDRGFDL
jgi:sulfide:quinone oxidoreductase